MKQVKQVHLLSTDKASYLTIRVKTKELMYSYKLFSPLNEVNINQHLYLTDISEIKEGDTFEFNSKIYTCDKVNKMIKVVGDNLWLPKSTDSINKIPIRKIVSSTDKELTPNSWIPESFVKKYIEMYNAGTPITEVNVEYQDDELGWKKIIKTREDDSIIISSSKTYTIEEVIKVANLVANKVKESPYILPFELNKFIEEHL